MKGALSETARPSPDRPRLLPGSRPPFRQSVGQGSARLALDSREAFRATAAADAIASDEIREII